MLANNAVTSKPQRPLTYSHSTYCAQSNNFSAPSEAASHSADSLLSRTKQSIDTLFEVNDVASLAKRLNESFENIHQEQVNQPNEIFWSLAAEMVSSFLNYYFTSASKVFEIAQLKPFMQDALWQKVDSKFQEILDFSIYKIDEFIKNEYNELDILFSIRSLYIFIKYIKNFNQQENNFLKIILFLSNYIKKLKISPPSLRDDFAIFISKILIKASTQHLKNKPYAISLKEPLKNLFHYFFDLKEHYDPFVSYRARYTCEALIDIYKSAATDKNGGDFSGLSSYKQSFWYVGLSKVSEIALLEFRDIEIIFERLDSSEKKLFLWGAYEILINRLFKINIEEAEKEKIFNFLKEILKRDESLIRQPDFFSQIRLPVEENFFWEYAFPLDQQSVLSMWKSKQLFSKKKSPSQFLADLKDLLSNPIFKIPSAYNYLLRHARRKIIKNLKQKIYSTKPVHQLNIRASAFRFFRHMKAQTPWNTRNIALIKYAKDNAGCREVVYLIAQSMGWKERYGQKIILPKRLIENKDRQARERGHSEAVLLAAQEIGHIRVESEGILSLDGFHREYCASIHEPCPEQLEGCQTDLLSSLAPMLYANEYKGKEHSNGFRDKLKAHEEKKRDKNALYESEPASEAEYEAIVLNEKYFEGMNLTNEKAKAMLGPVPARRLYGSFAGNLEDSSKELGYVIPPGYVLRDEHSNEISLIKKDGRIVKLGIKSESEVNQEEEANRLAAAIAIFMKI